MRDRTVVLLAVVAIASLTGGIAILAVTGPADSRPNGDTLRSVSVSNGTAGQFAELHAAGITGSNVSVGIVDPTGFDTESKAIAGQVAETRAFGVGPADETGEAHGTATAAVVSRTAPDADLYLARIDSVDSYQQAVDWLVREDVDVVVAPVSFYGQPGDGSGPVARSATRATERGSVFIAPAGNLAQSHWSGRYGTDTVHNRTVAFTNGSRRNYIRGGTEITVWLSWEQAHADEDYTVELYRTNGTDARLVARSQPYRGDDVPNERIVADVRPGDYYLVVRGPASPTGARLRLVSPTHELQYTAARNSIVAPGTARRGITVGAYNSRVEQLEPFSSRGPTVDERTGVDIVAPDRKFAAAAPDGFVGSSAAVPYVGGTVALLLEANESLTPHETERLLERTTRDVGRPGLDNQTGHGAVRPARAVRTAQNRTDG
ncbi:Subtilase family protein [Haloarcula vallismortis]|uniref:Subtilase family protease n=2 Tax=Haloarcula vallismortis TaxID=28442 RepID=M0JD23_HALVA|nr:S8 family serine peptidase [Haloarcula vallismortis]EMA05565.1 subtilase family protease [Haloarcula vallismortis ATCC 29715]SDW85733.1 Subtilase family protein [Haloarcula vallismortis]